MKEESIILNAYPLIKDSLLLASFEELNFPRNTDFGSIRIMDNDNRKLQFELIDKKDYSGKSDYFNAMGKSHIAIIVNASNIKHICISYGLSKNQGKYFIPEKKIEMNSFQGRLAVSTKKVSIFFGKNGYSIEKIKINGNEYGPLHLVASGGGLFFQKDMLDARFTIISDSCIVKMFRINGLMRVSGNKVAKEGFLPVQITYCFWSPDGIDMLAKAEIELEYDKAIGMNRNKAEFLNPLLWYRLDNFNGKLMTNSHCTNYMNGSEVTTLKHPYYGYFSDNGSFFAMCPYLALPNDGIHMEKGNNFFGASWHSMSQPKKPYWADEKENTGMPQGYFPMHSLRSYWKIGMYFAYGKKNIKNIASVFSYQPKIRSIVHMGSGEVSNACIARWKDNKKMAFNAITDDAKINDYLYRAKGKIPKWVQMAIATRTLGISYHRFCCIGNKIFYLKKYPLLSTLLSTLLCLLRIGIPFKKKFENENLSFIPHTNTHPRLYRLNANAIRREVLSSEKIWMNKWRNGVPLSHVFSYTSSYGLATEKGTMGKVAFSSSKHLQWIREWPIPNAPLDFFLPTGLLWGVCIGEFFDKSNSTRLKEEFIERYRNGCDYMLISGHAPEYDAECPGYVTQMFSFFEKHKDVWFAGADEIIKYYLARENTIVSSVKKQGKSFLIEIKNKLPHYFSTEITLIQHISKKINKIQFTADKKEYVNVNYSFIGKNLVMYNVPSNAKHVLIS